MKTEANAKQLIADSIKQINDILAKLSDDERAVVLGNLNYCHHCGIILDTGICHCTND